MTHRGFVAALAALLLTGCPNDSVAPQPSGSASIKTPSSAPPLTSGSATPTTSLTASPLPTGPVTFDHFALAAPPAANAACPPLPKGGAEPFRSIAATLRRLSCEPALFYRTAEALRQELALPADQQISFNGPSSVSLQFPPVRAIDLAKALGEASAQAARSKSGAWSFRNWYLTNRADGATLDRWSPGRVHIGLAVSDPGMELDLTPLAEAMTRGDATVSMPPETLPLKDDDVAAANLIAGLERVVVDKAQLANEPADIAKKVGLDDERFRVSRRAIGTGQDSVKGIDVWCARTQIGAAKVIEKLGLSGKIEPLRATDTNDYVLYDGNEDEHRWHGVAITLRFRPRDKAADASAPADFVLTGVTVMP